MDCASCIPSGRLMSGALPSWVKNHGELHSSVYVWVGCTVYFRPEFKNKKMTGSNGNGKQTNWKRKRVSLQTGQSQSISRTKTSQSSKTETNLSNPNTTQPTTTEINLSHPDSSQPTMSQQKICPINACVENL